MHIYWWRIQVVQPEWFESRPCTCTQPAQVSHSSWRYEISLFAGYPKFAPKMYFSSFFITSQTLWVLSVARTIVSRSPILSFDICLPCSLYVQGLSVCPFLYLSVSLSVCLSTFLVNLSFYPSDCPKFSPYVCQEFLKANSSLQKIPRVCLLEYN